MNTKNNAGIYIPPPLLYVGIFLISLLLQRNWPLDQGLLRTATAHIAGFILIASYFLVAVPAIRQFAISKNTLVTVKPATSLQTTGIYSFTRNPMYLSLVLLYGGLAVFFGNWWTFILLPLLIAIIQLYVIKKEEAYLMHTFGQDYLLYKRNVRRWI